MALPKYDALFNPVLSALRDLGGSATNTELDEKVASDLGLADQDLEETDTRGRLVFNYRMAWAKSYLKAYGLTDNSQRGVWSLTERGLAERKVNPAEVKRLVVREYGERRRSKKQAGSVEEAASAGETGPGEDGWRSTLMDRLRDMEPGAFERLARRLLRESGFVDVDVTGRSGDGGIDGKGTLRLAGLITFPVLFQCKRWQGSVGSREVRDLRGAMQGRADHGVIVTTGSFTRDARSEASRPGAPAVDLVDGEQLLDMLKQLGVGVKVNTVQVEEVTIEEPYFDSL